LEPLRDDALLQAPPDVVWRPRRKFRDRVWLHVVLFVLTIASTTNAGAGYYASYATDLLQRPLTLSAGQLALHALWYSVAVLLILGCHELGHYLACRYYDVDASLPFFLPAPLPLTGTLGAFIKIREPIPTKRMLFDIGIAGPIAGFAVAVTALLLGVSMSKLVPEMTRLPPGAIAYNFGDPLLMKLVEKALWGTLPSGFTLNLHPIAFAAWFGLLATALNLFPIGQLDGGHISYAVFGPRSTYVTLATIGVAIGLAWFSTSWIVWTGLMVVMLVAFGPRHPRTFDEDVPLDRMRIVLAVLALVMFVLCFTPAPIQVADLIKH
jgi:membrane-associated protease RseP (regulator of RpoE activity)